ncbi:probable methyltransferase BMT2 homolog isoform X2 [Centruroides sculpturatus]|nr:probable methyltransferase BMT2 homolog isoform X2 [Centruroides sculpturatus]
MLHDRDQLVATIRGVHEGLRKSYQQTSGNHDAVWMTHLNDIEKRKEYSKAMFQLATTAWLEKNTRITWCHQTCIDYFCGGKLKRLLEKSNLCNDKADNNCINKKIILPLVGKVKLLDVGSCYNPFSVYPEYQCTAIDLTPAVENVLQCDFLQLKISSQPKVSNLLQSEALTELSECTFDVVVFSLVLEYLPAPKQRFVFCQKAWKLLKYDGLLLIVTPDSKKQHCNAPMMKKWRLALEHIGFQRIAYEKQRHMHCMAFRKLFVESNDKTDDDIIQLLSIPQDFHHYEDDSLHEEQRERTEEENENIQICFTELPAFIG